MGISYQQVISFNKQKLVEEETKQLLNWRQWLLIDTWRFFPLQNWVTDLQLISLAIVLVRPISDTIPPPPPCQWPNNIIELHIVCLNVSDIEFECEQQKDKSRDNNKHTPTLFIGDGIVMSSSMNMESELTHLGTSQQSISWFQPH